MKYIYLMQNFTNKTLVVTEIVKLINRLIFNILNFFYLVLFTTTKQLYHAHNCQRPQT